MREPQERMPQVMGEERRRLRDFPTLDIVSRAILIEADHSP